MLMIYILGAHSKVQKEFLYLETGAIPLGQLISTQWMMYLQNILKHLEGEMLRKVFEAQNYNSVRGDWIELVKRCFNNVGMNLDEAEIQASTKYEFKVKVKLAFKNMFLTN